MSCFKVDVDVPRQVRRRCRREGIRLVTARSHDRERKARRLIWNAGRIVLGLRFSLILCLLLRFIDWLSGRIKDAYSPRRLLAGKVHIFQGPPAGVTGSNWVCWCKRTHGTWGEERDDLRECLRGLPLKRMMGVDGGQSIDPLGGVGEGGGSGEVPGDPREGNGSPFVIRL